MTSWKPCTSAPDVKDVIRWKEPIWAAPTKKRGKPDQIGEQALVAEVTVAGETYELLVREIKKISGVEAAEVKVKAGDSIRRKISTLERGDCEKQQ